MPPARLFISHSAREDPVALALIQRLYAELNGGDLEVLIDKKCLESGEDWNDQLIDWMLECHGAVLLLSKKALKSAWVEQEATILNLRKREDADFELLPVFLAGVDDTVLNDPAESRLTALNLPRLQALRAVDAAGNDALLAALRSKCDLLKKRWATDDPGRWLLKDIAAVLEDGHLSGLERLADEIDAQIKQWLWNRNRIYLTLALSTRMSEVGLDRVVRALEKVTSYYRLDQARAIVERLAPLRVNAEATRNFADVVARRNPAVGVILNAVEPDTGKLYARRAMGEELKTRFIDLTNCNEGHGAHLLEQEIQEAIVEFAKADSIPEAQEQLLAQGAPHFALLPARRPDGAVLQRIGLLFPTVRFCCLTGADLPADPLLVPLLPPLGPQDEDNLLKPYRRSRKRLIEIWAES
jgi:hypothetical protein